MILSGLRYCALSILLFDFLKSVISQTSTINLLDRKHENEPYYYDLSFVNSNFDSPSTGQNKFSTRDRSGSYSATKHNCQKIRPLPSSLRTDLKLSYFYQRYTEAYGIPIVGSIKVSTNALKRACYVLRFFLADRNDLKEILYKRNVRIVILGTTETLLNVPEYSSLPNSWNHVRGLSATPNIPLITVPDENLQCSNDKFKLEDLLVHEIAYSLITLNALDAQTRRRLEYYYAGAKNTVPWAQSFALVDLKEYFASGVDVYLNAKREQSRFSYDELRANDPNLFSLIREIFPCDNQFLNKCKTTREQEDYQALRIGPECELEANVMPPSTTPPTTTTTNTARNEYFLRQQQQQLVSTQSPTTTTTTTKPTTLSHSLVKSSKLVFLTPPTTTSTTTTSARPSTTSIQSDCVNLNEMCDLWARKGECSRNRQYMIGECPRSCGMCADQTTTRLSRKIESTTTKIDLSVFAGLCKDEFTHCPVFALRGDCKLNPHYMLQKCMRSCNLCGDLVDQKDRIQPTSKKPFSHRRPPGGAPSRPPVNSEYNDFQSYYHSMVGEETTSTSSTTTTTEEYHEPETEQHEETSSSNEPEQQESSSCKDLVGHCPQLAERGDCTTNEATMRYYCSKSCRFC